MTEVSTESAMPESLKLQQRAARMLSRAVVNRTTHAFMLSGNPGVGTHDAAMWIAQTVLCPQGGGDNCDVCRRVARRVHPDLLWLSAEGAQLLNEHVEDMVDQLVRKPFEAAAQVAVIADADTLGATNNATANRLLKVLEEPPGDVVFILLASLPDKVLPTIRSRVLDIRFPRLSDEDIRTWLASDEMSGSPLPLGIDATVRIAAGDLQRARELAEGTDALQRHQLVCNVASALVRGSLEPGDASVMLRERATSAQSATVAAAEAEFEAFREQLTKQDANRLKNTRDSDGHEARATRRGRRALTDELKLTLVELQTWYRDLLAVSQGATTSVIFVDAVPELTALAQTRAATNVVAALDTIEDLLGRLHLNADASIAVDAMCAELSGLAAGRLRARRTLGVGLKTPQGYEVTM